MHPHAQLSADLQGARGRSGAGRDCRKTRPVRHRRATVVAGRAEDPREIVYTVDQESYREHWRHSVVKSEDLLGEPGEPPTSRARWRCLPSQQCLAAASRAETPALTVLTRRRGRGL